MQLLLQTHKVLSALKKAEAASREQKEHFFLLSCWKVVLPMNRESTFCKIKHESNFTFNPTLVNLLARGQQQAQAPHEEQQRNDQKGLNCYDTLRFVLNEQAESTQWSLLVLSNPHLIQNYQVKKPLNISLHFIQKIAIYRFS